MIKFKLNDEYYIRNLDCHNWTIAKTLTAKKSGREKEYLEKFYGTLSSAYNGSIEFLAKKAESLQELEEIISRLEKLKITIIKHENKSSDTPSL